MVSKARLLVSKKENSERDGDREQMHKYKLEAKRILNDVATRLQRLEREVKLMASEPAMLGGELKRRQRMLRTLGESYNDCYAILMGKKRKGPIRDAEETIDTYNLSNEQIYSMHEQKLKNQDDALDTIHSGVKNLRNVAYDINVELDVQEGLLDDIDHEMDIAKNKVDANIIRVDKVAAKTKDKGCCCMMLLLLVVIVVLLVV